MTTDHDLDTAMAIACEPELSRIYVTYRGYTIQRKGKGPTSTFAIFHPAELNPISMCGSIVTAMSTIDNWVEGSVR